VANPVLLPHKLLEVRITPAIILSFGSARPVRSHKAQSFLKRKSIKIISYRSVSKQMTLAPFRMNAWAKIGRRHGVNDLALHHKRAIKRDLARFCKVVFARKWLGPLSVHPFSPAWRVAKKPLAAFA
jgi:hypothetical protein